MDAARYARLTDAFAAACDLDAEARRRYVDALALDDPDLARSLVELLAGDATGTLALDRGVALPDALELPAEARIGRYAITGALGTGGAGRVFDARVAESSALLGGRTRVALKVLHPDRAFSERALAAFAREAELGAAIVHPHLARTFESGTAEVDGRVVHWLAMERVEGRTLRDELRAEGPFPEPLCRVVGAAVARALAALHGAGIVHRDVKPSNVMISSDQVVKLTDLGIAVPPQVRRAEGFVGTLAYAAPEQVIDGAAVGPAADLYALGLVLHEMATGQRCRTGSDPAVLVRHVESAPPPRLPGDSDWSYDFIELVAALLARDPEQRPRDADDVADALELGEASRWWGGRALGARGAPPADRAPLRDRERESNALLDRISTTSGQDGGSGTRPGSVTLLRGPAGAGRHRLAAEALRELRRRGIDAPTLLVRDVDTAPEPERRAFLARARRAVEAGEAVLGTIGAEAEGTPFLAALLALDDVDVIDVGPLSQEGVRRVLRDQVGGESTAAALLPIALRSTGSLPAELLDLVRRLRASGHLTRLDADRSWVVSRPLADIPPASSLEERIDAALRGPSRLPTAILATAACDGAEVAFDDLAGALGRPVLEVVRDLDVLARATGLVRLQAGRLLFEPPVAAERIAARLDPDTRRAAHAAWCRHLAHGGGDTDSLRRCLHAWRAGDDELLTATADEGLPALADRGRHEELAAAGRAAGAVDTAPPVSRLRWLRLAERADMLRGRPRDRLEVLRSQERIAAANDLRDLLEEILARRCTALMDAGEFATLLREARALADDPSNAASTRADALRHLAFEAQRAGRFAEAEALEREGLALGTDGESRAALLMTLADTLFAQRRLDQAEPLFLEAGEMVERLDDDVLRTALLLKVHMLRRRQGRLDDAARALDAAQALAQKLDDRRFESVARVQRATLEQSRGNRVAARRELVAALSVYRELDADASLLLGWLGDLARQDGRFDAARERLRDALDEAERHASPIAALSATSFQVALARDEGRFGEAEAAAARQLEAARRIGHPGRIAIAELAGVEVALWSGRRPAQIEEELVRIERMLGPAPTPHRARLELLRATCAAASGDPARARGHIERARAAAERVDQLPVRVEVMRALCDLELAQGDREAALAVARELRTVVEPTRSPALDALSQTLLARSLEPPPDPALLEGARRLLARDGARMTLLDRAAILRHLLAAADHEDDRQAARRLLDEAARKSPRAAGPHLHELETRITRAPES